MRLLTPPADCFTIVDIWIAGYPAYKQAEYMTTNKTRYTILVYMSQWYDVFDKKLNSQDNEIYDLF